MQEGSSNACSTKLVFQINCIFCAIPIYSNADIASCGVCKNKFKLTSENGCIRNVEVLKCGEACVCE